MNDPFASVNALNLSSEDIRTLLVNRFDELGTAKSAIRNYNNVLLYGVRGVGKTFLVRSFTKLLNDEFPEIFPVYVNTAGLVMYNPVDEVAAFSKLVLLEICVDIWKHIFQKSYIDLRENITLNPNSLDFANRQEKIVKKIFSLLMTNDVVSKSITENQIGFSAGIKGKKGENFAIEKRASDILPFEFAEFVDELMMEVLSHYNKIRIVALCDDANRLPMFKQEEILSRYIDLFRRKKVQFLFVAAWHKWEEDVHIPLCFETVIEIEGFKDNSVFSEFLTKSSKGLVNFENDAMQLLHKKSEGVPATALEIARLSWLQSQKENRDVICFADVERSNKRYLAHQNYLRTLIKDEC